MHAGHERVLYEQLKAAHAAAAPASQQLLEPIVVELKAHELEAILESREDWEKAGFELDALGADPPRAAARPALLTGRTLGRSWLRSSGIWKLTCMGIISMGRRTSSWARWRAGRRFMRTAV